MSIGYSYVHTFAVICVLHCAVITQGRSFGSRPGVWGVSAPSSSPSLAPTTPEPESSPHKKRKRVKRVKKHKKIDSDLKDTEGVLTSTDTIEQKGPSTGAEESAFKPNVKGTRRIKREKSTTPKSETKKSLGSEIGEDSLPSVRTLKSNEEETKKKRVKKVKKGSRNASENAGDSIPLAAGKNPDEPTAKRYKTKKVKKVKVRRPTADDKKMSSSFATTSEAGKPSKDESSTTSSSLKNKANSRYPLEFQSRKAKKTKRRKMPRSPSVKLASAGSQQTHAEMDPKSDSTPVSDHDEKVTSKLKQNVFKITGQTGEGENSTENQPSLSDTAGVDGGGGNEYTRPIVQAVNADGTESRKAPNELDSAKIGKETQRPPSKSSNADVAHLSWTSASQVCDGNSDNDDGDYLGLYTESSYDNSGSVEVKHEKKSEMDGSDELTSPDGNKLDCEDGSESMADTGGDNAGLNDIQKSFLPLEVSEPMTEKNEVNKDADAQSSVSVDGHGKGTENDGGDRASKEGTMDSTVSDSAHSVTVPVHQTGFGGKNVGVKGFDAVENAEGDQYPHIGSVSKEYGVNTAMVEQDGSNDQSILESEGGKDVADEKNESSAGEQAAAERGDGERGDEKDEISASSYQPANETKAKESDFEADVHLDDEETKVKTVTFLSTGENDSSDSDSDTGNSSDDKYHEKEKGISSPPNRSAVEDDSDGDVSGTEDSGPKDDGSSEQARRIDDTAEEQEAAGENITIIHCASEKGNATRTQTGESGDADEEKTEGEAVNSEVALSAEGKGQNTTNDNDVDHCKDPETKATPSSTVDKNETQSMTHNSTKGPSDKFAPDSNQTDDSSFETKCPVKVQGEAKIHKERLDENPNVPQETAIVYKEPIQSRNVPRTPGKRPNLNIKELSRSMDADSDIHVSVVTWNLAEESPKEEDGAFIKDFRNHGVDGKGSDFVLISGQECENIKPRRTEGRRSKEFRRLMVKLLGKRYVPIAIHQLGGIQFGLFCRRSILTDVESVSVADVTCGIGNVFHNKGAIAAFVCFKARNKNLQYQPQAKSLNMLFVSAHLAAHIKNSDARDADFWRIMTELEAQAPPAFVSPVGGGDNSGGNTLLNAADRLFFCGDLNYRLGLPREIAEYSVQKIEEYSEKGDEESVALSTKLRTSLLKHDQLRSTIAARRAFVDLAEGEITFAPTFKYDKNSDEFDTSHKQRIPAWTDRVLFKPSGTRVIEYRSVPDAKHSDHRPVFATFRVKTEGRPEQTRGTRKNPKKSKTTKQSKEKPNERKSKKKPATKD